MLTVHDVSNIYHVPLILVEQVGHRGSRGRCCGSRRTARGRGAWLSRPPRLFCSWISSKIGRGCPSCGGGGLPPTWMLAATCPSPVYLPRVMSQDLHSIFKRQLRFEGMEPPDMQTWTALARVVDSVTVPVRIAIVGKYTGLQDSYLSVIKVRARRRATPKEFPCAPGYLVLCLPVRFGGVLLFVERAQMRDTSERLGERVLLGRLPSHWCAWIPPGLSEHQRRSSGERRGRG